jgi:hypothetical protein
MTIQLARLSTAFKLDMLRISANHNDDETMIILLKHLHYTDTVSLISAMFDITMRCMTNPFKQLDVDALRYYRNASSCSHT